VRYYAWIAQSKKDRLLYDFLWCVALSEDLKSEPASYLFTKTQIEKMPSAEECKEIFQFRGKAYRQIAYIPDVQTWSCQGWMKDFETYNLRNIDELRLFLS
jgi:hypothetical protein